MDENIQYHNELFNETIENFGAMYDAGEISADEYNQLLTNAYLELQERVQYELGIEDEDIEELVGEELVGAEYSQYDDDLATFSVGNTFGSALVEIGDTFGYEDIEQYCVELGDSLGVDPNDILGVIEGDILPSDDLALAVGDLFELDDNIQGNLLVSAIESRGDDVYDYLDEEEDEDEDDYYDASVPVADEAIYSKVHQLENTIAEFEINSTIQNRLYELSNQVYDLVERGKMPPIAAQTLIGSPDLESDHLAAFSTVCDTNQVDPATQLYAMEMALGLFERMPSIEFGYSVNEEITDEEFEEEIDIQDIAENYVQSLLKN